MSSSSDFGDDLLRGVCHKTGFPVVVPEDEQAPGTQGSRKQLRQHIKPVAPSADAYRMALDWDPDERVVPKPIAIVEANADAISAVFFAERERGTEPFDALVRSLEAGLSGDDRQQVLDFVHGRSDEYHGWGTGARYAADLLNAFERVFQTVR